MEQLEYSRLSRWLVGHNMAAVPNTTVFRKNRDEVLENEIVEESSRQVSLTARQHVPAPWHSTVLGTSINVRASHQSFKPKNQDDSSESLDSNSSVDSQREMRKENAGASTTDLDTLLCKKSTGAQKKDGLTTASGAAERDAAVPLAAGITDMAGVSLAAPKGYASRAGIGHLRDLNVTPHIAVNDTNRQGCIAPPETRQPRHTAGPKKRKAAGQMFVSAKAVGLTGKAGHRDAGRAERRPHSQGKPGPMKRPWGFAMFLASMIPLMMLIAVMFSMDGVHVEFYDLSAPRIGHAVNSIELLGEVFPLKWSR